jgi:hypothetical protein
MPIIKIHGAGNDPVIYDLAEPETYDADGTPLWATDGYDPSSLRPWPALPGLELAWESGEEADQAERFWDLADDQDLDLLAQHIETWLIVADGYALPLGDVPAWSYGEDFWTEGDFEPAEFRRYVELLFQNWPTHDVRAGLVAMFGATLDLLQEQGVWDGGPTS